MTEAKEPKVEVIKITDQFRSRNGFVYDFRFEGSRLTLSIAPREGPTDPGDWKVEARTPHSPEPFIITKWGPTRVDALHELAAAWPSEATTHGLPSFDWAAVEKALKDVRAL
jgi:hypothetical protein